jgi:Flp pilus assembly protein TadD
MQGKNHYHDGIRAGENGDWTLAKQEICQAAQNNPGKSLYQFQCALANAYLAYQNKDELTINAALEAQNAGLSLDPYWYIHWANLASYEWQVGEKEKAIEHMRKATIMAPKIAILWVNLAWMEEQLGQADLALDDYQVALCLNPWYKDTIFFNESKIFQNAGELGCEEIKIKLTSYNKNMWQGWLALKNRNFQVAEEYFKKANLENNQSPEPYSYMAVLHQLQGNNEQAQKEIQTAFYISNQYNSNYWNAAKIATLQGDNELARENLIAYFNLVLKTNLSKNYYPVAYRDVYMQRDLSPYLLTHLLTPEREQALNELIDWFKEQEDFESVTKLELLLRFQDQEYMND